MGTYLTAIGVHAVQWALSGPSAFPRALPVLLIGLTVLGTAVYCRRVSSIQAVAVLLVCAAAAAAMFAIGGAPGCDPSQLLDGGVRSAGQRLIAGEIVQASRSEFGSLRLRVRTSAPLCGKILVTVKHPRRPWPVGRKVRFRSYLRRIGNFGNPGEFDWAAWNARRGVLVSAYLWNDDELQDRGVARGLAAGVASLRMRIDVAAAAAGGEGGGLMRALLVGDRDGLDPHTKESFRRAGLAHVLAISGLHVGIVAATVLLAIRALVLLAWPSFAAGHDVYRPASCAAGLAIAAYAAISGGGVSVLRSLIMAELALASLWYGRPASLPYSLAYAAVVIAFVLPGVVTEASFQLSFAAVTALLGYGLYRGRPGAAARGKSGLVVEAFAASFAAWYATLPFAAQHFGRVSLLGPLATPLVLPPLTVVLAVGFAACLVTALSLPGAWLLFRFAAACAGFLVKFVAVIAALPFSSFAVAAPGWGLVWVWLALPGAVLLDDRYRYRALVVLALVGIALVGSGLRARYRGDRLDVVFVSVGQGDATLIRLPGGRVVLVDTGPPGRGRLAVLPLLRRMWIGRIDTLILTHVQADHWGAAPELLGNVEIGEIWRPSGPCEHSGFLGFERHARDIGVSTRAVDSTESPVVGGRGERRWSLRVLGPTRSDRDCGDNDASIVIRIAFAGHAALFVGDAEALAEHELLAAGADLRAEILKAGHHGSRTSSTPEFIDAVSPEISIASVGLANRYGFPHERVRALFESRAVRLYRTDLDGAVAVTLASAGITVRTSKPR